MVNKRKNIFKKKNRKADLPVTILVIGVFAVCSLALFSFLMSSLEAGNSFIGVGLMENLNSQINSYYFYKSKGISEDILNSKFNIQENKLIVKKTDERFSLTEGFDSGNWRKKILLFSVEYNLPK